MNWTLLIYTGVGLYVLSYIWALTRNYLKARKTGFPIVINPISPSNPFALLGGPAVIWLFARVLPDWAWVPIRGVLHGWEFVEEQTRTKYYQPGGAVMMVTPGANVLWVHENYELIETILSNKRDFVQAEVTQLLIGIFGPNVMVVNGADWQRHRRIVTQALNGTIVRLVWEESTKQTNEMLEELASLPNGETNLAIDGFRDIAINVLSAAGYGTPQSWKSEKNKAPPGYELAYTQVLHILTSGFFILALLPAKVVSLPIWPKSIRQIGVAGLEFKRYTTAMLARERAASKASAATRRDFLSTVVQLSNDPDLDVPRADSKRNLSEDEIQGNLFQFSLAGFDTTANTLAYAISLLAIHPEWQDWIVEEVDRAHSGNESSSYEPDEVFAKFPRCLALMYETLRLFSPLSNIGRSTAAPTTVTTSAGTYHLPANTQINVSFARLHYDPSYWGPTASEFDPSRWLSDSSTAHPRPFIPWSTGPRQCPGMKMSQIEFFAVVSTLFRACTVRPSLVSSDETPAQARARLEGVVRDSQPKLTLQMNRPGDMGLVWTRRMRVGEEGGG